MTLKPNNYCHNTKDVIEYLISIDNNCSDWWWDYVTALRGDDFSENTSVKSLFTCFIRGVGENNRSLDIQACIDYLYWLDSKPHLSTVVNKMCNPKYTHYRSHICVGLDALQRYYLHLAFEHDEEQNKQVLGEDGKIYKKCSDLLDAMNQYITVSAYDQYFMKMKEFLLLVTSDDGCSVNEDECYEYDVDGCDKS
jgi:hypothetical protein